MDEKIIKKIYMALIRLNVIEKPYDEESFDSYLEAQIIEEINADKLSDNDNEPTTETDTSKGGVIHRFSNGNKVKISVSKIGKNYHHKRKGSVGVVIKTAISLNKPCYWLMFADGYEEWFEEWELNGV